MSENRREVLDSLETILGTVTGVTTVVRSLMAVDITQYNIADLPLINIEEPEETADEEMTGMRDIMFLDTLLHVFFLYWGEDPDSVYEDLTKNIRDKIGDNFTLNGKAITARVMSVSKITGTLPVFGFEIGVLIKYYLNLKAT